MTTPTNETTNCSKDGFELRWTCKACGWAVPVDKDAPRLALKTGDEVHVCVPTYFDGSQDPASSLLDLYCSEDSRDALPPITPKQVDNFAYCQACDEETTGIHWCNKDEAVLRQRVLKRQRLMLPPIPKHRTYVTQFKTPA